ncbi:RloB family protein [Clostridium sp. Marseille-P2415]|uniref:RloB family protein n=1 Tax=Clostridium sp. Marseille-P2415 TaxID=1805471 RepID=UPI00098837ED|nr:RloB family protein [Clostridium sp. Marseille-P2415]
MAPIRSYTNWNVRSTDNDAQIEPYRHYYFICEGRNTEKWYFEKLIDIRKELSIHSDIELVYLEKTDEDENLSNPTQLIDFADQQKRNGAIAFDHKFDKMIVVFDADVFESIYTDYNEVIAKGLQKNLLGVTNPSFELFLLLHYPNSVDELILTDQVNIIANNWVGNGQNRRRYIENLFRKKSGMRPKSNSAIGELAHDVLIAIEQEKKLNNDISICKGTITSNIGCIIESIIRDQCN